MLSGIFESKSRKLRREWIRGPDEIFRNFIKYDKGDKIEENTRWRQVTREE